MFCFYLSDVLVVKTNEDFASMYNVVEESTCFMGCEEFLFTNHIFQLCVVEFLQKSADDVFVTVNFL